MESKQPSNLDENLPFCKARTVVQHTSAGQFTENVGRATSDTPKIFNEITSLVNVEQRFRRKRHRSTRVTTCDKSKETKLNFRSYATSTYKNKTKR